MLRSVRLTISLLMLGSGVVLWLNPSNPTDASAARTFTQTPKAEKFTGKDEPTDAELARRFNQTVRPFMASYCIGCHRGPAPAASFDLQPYPTIKSVIQDFGHWALVRTESPRRKCRQA